MDDLTVRILELLARGLVTSEAAERLGLPADVVRDRLQRAQTEAGVASRLELLLLAIRSGAVSLSGE